MVGGALKAGLGPWGSKFGEMPALGQPEKSRKVNKGGSLSTVGKYWWSWRVFATKHNTKIMLAWMVVVLASVRIMKNSSLRERLNISCKLLVRRLCSSFTLDTVTIWCSGPVVSMCQV